MRVVDIFSGAGGFSEGARLAGAQVVWAANHWPHAVHWHRANHTGTEHVCQDLNLFPSCDIPKHDLLLASPSCKGFSPARGKHQAHHDKHRATAWIVVDVLEAQRPKFALIENVPQMRDWILYQPWRHAIESLGYTLVEHIFDAADCGVPQHRKRLFITAVKANRPLKLAIEKRPHNPINTVLEWNSGRWSDIYTARRSANTIARIENGLKDGLGPRFLAPYYGAAKSGRSVNRPIGTLTTKPRYALIDTNRQKMRMLSIVEARRAMGFADDYQLPKNSEVANTLLGNAVCPPVAKELVAQIMNRG